MKKFIFIFLITILFFLTSCVTSFIDFEESAKSSSVVWYNSISKIAECGNYYLYKVDDNYHIYVSESRNSLFKKGNLEVDIFDLKLDDLALTTQEAADFLEKLRSVKKSESDLSNTVFETSRYVIRLQKIRRKVRFAKFSEDYHFEIRDKKVEETNTLEYKFQNNSFISTNVSNRLVLLSDCYPGDLDKLLSLIN